VSSKRSIRHRPAVDERLIMPGTRYEILEGDLVYVSPAREPHASRHSKLSALLEAYAAHGYNAASDMLTRASEQSDVAPDGCIYPEARDPETGGRQLEELAFEVVSTERLAHAGAKAAALVTRGVRRVFAIDVERRRALEWSSKTQSWEILSHGATVEDPALVLPLPIRDLVDAAKADDAVARALIAKNNPVIVGAINEGKAEGKAEAVVAVLRGRGLSVPAAVEERILACRDLAQLDTWLRGAATATSVEALLA
jgi:Uma2 family endonuclease